MLSWLLMATWKQRWATLQWAQCMWPPRSCSTRGNVGSIRGRQTVGLDDLKGLFPNLMILWSHWPQSVELAEPVFLLNPSNPHPRVIASGVPETTQVSHSLGFWILLKHQQHWLFQQAWMQKVHGSHSYRGNTQRIIVRKTEWTQSGVHSTVMQLYF